MSTKPEAGFGIDAESTLDVFARPIEVLEKFIRNFSNLIEKLIAQSPKK